DDGAVDLRPLTTMPLTSLEIHAPSPVDLSVLTETASLKEVRIHAPIKNFSSLLRLQSPTVLQVRSPTDVSDADVREVENAFPDCAVDIEIAIDPEM
ncbi:MAG: hypothetical protein N2C14_09655, partial [Planctomycetales bacterium]